MPANEKWKVSLHGSHTGEFCNHARGTLDEFMESAIEKGFKTYGVSEHAPRHGDQFLYDDEVEMGWDTAKLINDFERYAARMDEVIEKFSDRLTILKGFEIEVVPADSYVELMLGYKEKFNFDYMVGSVHYVEEIQIDGTPDCFINAMDKQGGLERLSCRYYETVVEMVKNIKPDVIGHFDLVRKLAVPYGSVETSVIKESARKALEVIKEHSCILDLNTAGYRKGLGAPYPAPWIVQEANQMGIGFCFGDDSHEPHEVGADFDKARNYLLENGVETVTTLQKENGIVRRAVISL